MTKKDLAGVLYLWFDWWFDLIAIIRKNVWFYWNHFKKWFDLTKNFLFDRWFSPTTVESWRIHSKLLCYHRWSHRYPEKSICLRSDANLYNIFRQLFKNANINFHHKIITFCFKCLQAGFHRLQPSSKSAKNY